MAVPAIDVNHSTEPVKLCDAAAIAIRDAREKVLRAFAAIDQLRDDGAIGDYFATKVGGTTGEATSVLDAVAPPRRQIPTSKTSPWPAVAMLLVALVIAAGTAYFISRGDTGGGGGGGAGGGGANDQQISIVSATDYDPQGDQEEHSDEVDLSIDDDRSATAWTTETYETDSFGDKSGVGIYVDAGQPVDATEMFTIVEDLADSRGWDIRVRRQPPTALDTGTINAIAMTLLGWRDEVAIRVTGTAQGSTIDMRSVPLGRFHDFGENGRRIEEFLLALDEKITLTLRNAPQAPTATDTEAPPAPAGEDDAE